MIDLGAAIGRLDELANAFDRLARTARTGQWPSRIIAEAESVTRLLVEQAAALDTADDQASARAALAQARGCVRDAFASLGRAVADELAAGTKLNTWSRARSADANG